MRSRSIPGRGKQRGTRGIGSGVRRKDWGVATVPGRFIIEAARVRYSFVRSFGGAFAGLRMKRMASLVWFRCWMSMLVGPSLPRRSSRCGAAANTEPRLCRSPLARGPCPS
jgi:hypothetical protein